MIFTKTTIPGVYRIDIEPQKDERGFFARTFCIDEYGKSGIPMNIVQTNISHNSKKGTLRGLHMQRSPFAEDKIVTCTHGAIFDVVVDMRAESATYRSHVAIELSRNNRQLLFIPKGCAHGFLTLEDDTDVTYLMSEFFHPECAQGYRYDDPAFGIAWPIPVAIISEKDKTYPIIQAL